MIVLKDKSGNCIYIKYNDMKLEEFMVWDNLNRLIRYTAVCDDSIGVTVIFYYGRLEGYRYKIEKRCVYDLCYKLLSKMSLLYLNDKIVSVIRDKL